MWEDGKDSEEVKVNEGREGWGGGVGRWVGVRIGKSYSFSSCLLDEVSWDTLLSSAFILFVSLCCSS